MHVTEMRRREAFSTVLAATLARGWSHEIGTAVEVRASGTLGQLWRERRPFGAFTVERPEAACRAFLRDSFRFTPVTWRLPAQWLLGTACATTVGLSLCAGETLTVDPPLAAGRSLVVLPGNMRVRIFDFSRGVVRVLGKEGFDSRGLDREVAVRGCGASGPFPAIKRSDVRQGWFEEPIVDAVALPRCPPGWHRTALLMEALDALGQWSAPTRVDVEAGEWAAHVAGRLRDLTSQVAGRFSDAAIVPPDDVLARLVSAASTLGSVSTAVGHGDFQPGNVLVGKRDRSVTIIDWEHSARRYSMYDRMVAALGSRAPRGLARRVAQFVAGSTPTALAAVAVDRPFRIGMAALLVLEDLVWYAEESLSGPFQVPSLGLIQYLEEVPGIADLIGVPGAAG